jgi:hypothetical protein
VVGLAEFTGAVEALPLSSAAPAEEYTLGTALWVEPHPAAPSPSLPSTPVPCAPGGPWLVIDAVVRVAEFIEVPGALLDPAGIPGGGLTLGIIISDGPASLLLTVTVTTSN